MSLWFAPNKGSQYGGDQSALQPDPEPCTVFLTLHQAQDMVEKINMMDPDMLIHLGDVYYSGTYDEEHDYFYT